MTISIVGTAHNNANSAAPAITLPAGIVAGDLIYILVHDGGSQTLTTPPAGFTLVNGPQQAGAGTCQGWIYSKTADGSESSTTITMGLSASLRWYTMAWVVRGGTFDAITYGVAASALQTSNTVTGFTPVAADCLALFVMDMASASGVGSMTTTPPTGWTELVDSSGTSGSLDQGVYLASKQLAGQAGVAQSSTTCATNVNHRANGWVLTIAPVVATLPTIPGQAANSGTGTALSVTLPAGITAGDEIYLLLHDLGNNSLTTAPAGYGLRNGPQQAGANTCQSWVYSKTATGTESGTTVTAAISGSTRWAMGAVVVRDGVFDQITYGVAAAANQLNNDIPAFTPQSDNCLAILLMGLSSQSGVGNLATTPPSGWTEVEDYSSAAGTLDASFYVASKQLTGQANTAQAATTCTSNVNHRANAFMLTVRPSPPSGGGGPVWLRCKAGAWVAQVVTLGPPV